jgi:hypothetical protein
MMENKYMLSGEADRIYIVYPSWAEFSYRWEDLPRLLSDPLASSYTDPNCGGYTKENKVEYWRSLEYPTENISPAIIINGPGGGGIIYVDKIPPGGRWLPIIILRKEGNMPYRPNVHGPRDKFPFKVCNLEPFDHPILALAAGKRIKMYLCSATPEHIDSDPEGIYWAVGRKKGRKNMVELDHVPKGAKALGIEASRLSEAPEIIREETASWYVNPEYEVIWFSVHGGINGAGYQYAVVLYFALHLRSVIGPRMDCMHLVASIEGKPRVRFKRAN